MNLSLNHTISNNYLYLDMYFNFVLQQFVLLSICCWTLVTFGFVFSIAAVPVTIFENVAQQTSHLHVISILQLDLRSVAVYTTMRLQTVYGMQKQTWEMRGFMRGFIRIMLAGLEAARVRTRSTYANMQTRRETQVEMVGSSPDSPLIFSS